MARYFIIFCLIFLFFWRGASSHPAQSQTTGCQTLVDKALSTIGTSCAALGRNEACYGHTLVKVTFQKGVDPVSFKTSGDIADLVDLESLTTQPADLDAGTWGVALLKVQADLPDEGDKALTLVLLGDTEITRAESSSDDQPMQAFTLRSGTTSACEEAPDGLLIQSPAGERAHVTVNGVQLEFASAGFLTAQPDKEFTIRGLEGKIIVTAYKESVTVLPGQETSVPLEGLAPSGPPALPVTSANSQISLDLLPQTTTTGCTVSSPSAVNIRQGPGTNYAVTGQLTMGQPVDGQAQGADGMKWWRIGEGRWVRSDIVAADGTCDSVPQAEIPQPPAVATAAPATSGGASDVITRHFVINGCSGVSDGAGPIQGGQTVRFAVGCCGSATVNEQQQQEAAAGTPWISLDGMPLSIYMSGIFFSPDGWYTDDGRSEWTAVPGSHTVSGGWGSSSDTCSFVVEG